MGSAGPRGGSSGRRAAGLLRPRPRVPRLAERGRLGLQPVPRPESSCDGPLGGGWGRGGAHAVPTTNQSEAQSQSSGRDLRPPWARRPTRLPRAPGARVESLRAPPAADRTPRACVSHPSGLCPSASKRPRRPPNYNLPSRQRRPSAAPLLTPGPRGADGQQTNVGWTPCVDSVRILRGPQEAPSLCPSLSTVTGLRLPGHSEHRAVGRGGEGPGMSPGARRGERCLGRALPRGALALASGDRAPAVGLRLRHQPPSSPGGTWRRAVPETPPPPTP